MLCRGCHIFSVVVTYNIFPSHCVITHTCVSESEIRTKKCGSQSVMVLHWSFTLSSIKGSRQIARERGQLLCVIPPVASMSRSLRDGWLQSISAKFSPPSLLSQYAECTVVTVQAGEQRQRCTHSVGLLLCPEINISGASFIKKGCTTDLIEKILIRKGSQRSAELSLMCTVLYWCREGNSRKGFTTIINYNI